MNGVLRMESFALFRCIPGHSVSDSGLARGRQVLELVIGVEGRQKRVRTLIINGGIRIAVGGSVGVGCIADRLNDIGVLFRNEFRAVVSPRFLKENLVRGVDLRGTALGASEDTGVVLGGTRSQCHLLSSSAIGTRAVAVGTGGLRRSICILVAAAGFDSPDVFRRLDLITPYHRAGIYCSGAVDVPCVLHLKQFGNLTRVHALLKHYAF